VIATKTKVLNCLNKFPRIVGVKGANLDIAEEMLDRDVHLVRILAVRRVATKESGVDVLEYKRDDLTVKAVNATFFCEADVVGRNDIPELSGGSLERMR
jgi:hypothetical protein